MSAEAHGCGGESARGGAIRAVTPPVLPDVVASDLDILFCGTAAGAASAAKGAYYAGPGNAFWKTLHAVGLTPRRLAPREYLELLGWKLGLTDLAKHVSGSDAALGNSHFDAERVRDLVIRHRPRILAFTGKRAARAFAGGPVPYGLLPASVGGTRLFVLPSPSGAARRFWDTAVWRDLAALRHCVACGPETGRQSSRAGNIAPPNRMRL